MPHLPSSGEIVAVERAPGSGVILRIRFGDGAGEEIEATVIDHRPVVLADAIKAVAFGRHDIVNMAEWHK